MANMKSGNTQDLSNNQNISLMQMLSMLGFLKDAPDPDEPKETIVGSFKIKGYEEDLMRVEGDSISYGAPAKIDINNIHTLGLGDDIQPLKMDENGNFYEPENGIRDDSMPADPILSINSPEMFLNDVSTEGDSEISIQMNADGKPVYGALEDASFYIRRVEKEEETTGFFISPHEDGKFGYYLGTDDIDYANLPEEMRNTLSVPEQSPPLDHENSPTSPEINNAPMNDLNALQPL